jgi:hypothetical protein
MPILRNNKTLQSDSLKNTILFKKCLAGMTVLVSFLMTGAFSAQENPDLSRFEVSHAQTSIIDGKYFLTADIAYRLHSEAIQILERGLPIRIELQVELFLQRRYWRDKTILEKNKIYTLKRNALTERFILTASDEQTQQSFATAEQAINSLRILEGVYLTEESNILDPQDTQARARLIVDVRHFPEPLQYLSKYWDDWRLVSEWYVWPLKL